MFQNRHVEPPIPAQHTRHVPRLFLFYCAFLIVALATRVALVVHAAHDLSWNLSLLEALAVGALFDVGAASLASLPFAIAYALLPERWLARRWSRRAAGAAFLAALVMLLFGAVAEWTFWDEFGARFNFIAVDYLVYTREVLGNIRESYPLPAILAGVLAAAFIAWWLLERVASPVLARFVPARRPVWMRGACLGLPIVLGFALGESRLPTFGNAFNREIAKNGLWSLCAAFRSNALDYEQFYRTMPVPVAFDRLREELVEDGSLLLRPEANDTLRYVKSVGPELRPNVIQITVESLSAEFVGAFNAGSMLTPGLDEIAEKSLVFDNLYATGTRTDRGMEALALSLPPTPGRSMIKRPRNESLFTLGSVFRAKGYDTAFLYGGFGYFDNMNYFFGSNGYRVVDRSSVEKSDVTFSNVWGACDEDLYRWTLREADAAHAANQPFHFFVMTTSNHRPYTFPDGRIDLESKTSGRAGAVKYTDYAIREFLRASETHPWFRDTVFVIVADHCASSAGKAELPIEQYHIPLIVYAPGGHVAPGRIGALMSQMDYAPTLLGLLNWSYPSRFFGHDVRRVHDDETHALVGNYQRLGHVEKGVLVVLNPGRGESTYRFDATTRDTTPTTHDSYSESETIAFYQSASYLYANDAYKMLDAAQFDHFTRLGERLAAARTPATMNAR